MVYRGPSQACSRCKARRVKCDLTRPACRNCTRRNEACPGFAATLKAGEVIIDETNATIQAFRKRNKVVVEQKWQANDAQPAWGISEDDIFVSVCFFFSNYAMPNRGIQSTRSELKYLPAMYANASPDSTICQAVRALTLSFLSMWQGLGPDSAQSQLYVRRAVSNLRSDLLCPKRSIADETLLAIMMLQFRDTIVGTSNRQSCEDVHQRGAYALVRHRASHGFDTPLAKQLIHSLRNSTIFEALRWARRVDTSQAIWHIRDGPSDDPNDALSWIGVEVANLQSEFEYYTGAGAAGRAKPTDDDLGKVEEWRDAAMILDRALVQWSEAQSPLWRPVAVPAAMVPVSVRQAGMYRELCHVYPSVAIAGVWHNYRFQRFILLKTIICCERVIKQWNTPGLTPGGSTVSTKEISPQKSLQHLVDEICAAVPFQLGNRTDTGGIHEFGNVSDVEYPFSSSMDPWWNRFQYEINGTCPQENRFSAAERKHEALALGGWNLLGPLGLTLKMLNEPVHLWPCGEELKLASLLQEGQTQWMRSQVRRVLIVQKMISKDSPFP